MCSYLDSTHYDGGLRIFFYPVGGRTPCFTTSTIVKPAAHVNAKETRGKKRDAAGWISAHAQLLLEVDDGPDQTFFEGDLRFPAQ